MVEQIDIKLRVMVVGDHGVGKTSLIRRYMENTFTESYIATVGVDFSAKSMVIPVLTKQGTLELKIRYMLYDIGGQSQFQNRIEAWAPQTMVYVICFDLTQPITLQHVTDWDLIISRNVDKLSQTKGFPIPHTFVLIGTKKDLSPVASNRAKNKHITSIQLQKICKSLGIKFFMETSSKNGENVANLFDALGKLAFNNLIRLNQAELIQSGVSANQLNEKFHEKHGYYPNLTEISLG